MKTLVELIRSPQVGNDRHAVKKLRDGQEVRRRWAVGRREGGLPRGSDRAIARVLPYMDDFMVITKTQDHAFVQRDRVSKLLPRLGLFQNENPSSGGNVDLKRLALNRMFGALLSPELTLEEM
ncbi:hypothetical protein CYMTET_48989 [Cymbomonas tetramitiformis]|uniref:Uncharacterized protein n=1 Tax=Cymbomonas tetramitiformis TaxID=36881 RepID=A0AAE0EUC2_9CHLO|nr:hypothetical protein CYMTET_48989 [Cymbomonas tetramitiformis]